MNQLKPVVAELSLKNRVLEENLLGREKLWNAWLELCSSRLILPL